MNKKSDLYVVQILLPALRGLESIVLRELERLHDVSVNQELRLEKLENSHYQQAEVLAAAELVRYIFLIPFLFLTPRKETYVYCIKSYLFLCIFHSCDKEKNKEYM